MPPHREPPRQQLFARQLAVAFLHLCARLQGPVSLVNSRAKAAMALRPQLSMPRWVGCPLAALPSAQPAIQRGNCRISRCTSPA
jgi:hypothetical protein